MGTVGTGASGSLVAYGGSVWGQACSNAIISKRRGPWFLLTMGALWGVSSGKVTPSDLGNWDFHLEWGRTLGEGG